MPIGLDIAAVPAVTPVPGVKVLRTQAALDHCAQGGRFKEISGFLEKTVHGCQFGSVVWRASGLATGVGERLVWKRLRQLQLRVLRAL